MIGDECDVLNINDAIVVRVAGPTGREPMVRDAGQIDNVDNAIEIHIAIRDQHATRDVLRVVQCRRLTGVARSQGCRRQNFAIGQQWRGRAITNVDRAHHQVGHDAVTDSGRMQSILEEMRWV